MKNEIQIRATIKFKHNLDKLFPHKKSTREKTEELNKILEELIYGKTK